MKKASYVSLMIGMLLALALPGWALIPLSNPSFESPIADSSEPAPTDWTFFTSGPNSSGVVSSQFARTGGQSLLFFAPPEAENAGSFQGYFQSVTLTVAPGTLIEFSGWFRAHPGFPLAGNARLKLGIEFKRADNSEINRVETEILPGQLSQDSWTLFSVGGSPVGETASSLTFTLVQLNGALPNSGIAYVDDVQAIPEPSSLALVLAAVAGLGWYRRTKKREHREQSRTGHITRTPIRNCIEVIAIVVLMMAASPTIHATLILNSSFESPVADSSEPAPDNWTFFTSGPNSSGVVSSEFARTGGQVLQFYAPPEPENVSSFQGYFQDTNLTLAVSNRVVYSVYLRSSPGLPLASNASAKIGIEFRSGGSELHRAELVLQPYQIPTNAWQLFTVTGINTAAVDQLRFTIVQQNGASLPNSGIFWAEDAQASVIPEPSLLGLLMAGGWVIHAAHRKRNKKRK